jgi:vanillate O-demethylase ferredoxin subunit
MLAAFEEAARSHPSDQVHVEYFSAKELPLPTGGFIVELARTQRSFVVSRGHSQLCFANGIDIPYSCEEGICGTCKTRVLSGQPDHRDMVLSEAGRQSNQVMMICCSECKGEKLALDL